MNESSRVNIFNIPANYHFFESLFNYLLKNFSDKIADVKIFLPNHRSCRELTKLFLQKESKNSSIILPKIKAISDISYEDFFDFLTDESKRQEVQETIDELLQIKVISDIDYLFFLSKEIQNLAIFGENLDSSQSLIIADNIRNLFDEIEKEEIDLNRIDEIDDSDLSNHRQITLEFLRNFYKQVKNSFIKNNIYFASSYQNLVINKFIQTIEKQGSNHPIILAGSTGSTSFGKKLIKAISKQNNCQIILHGLESDITNDLEIEEQHPQFLLNELLRFLDITKKQVKHISLQELQMAPKTRNDFISLMMLPASKTTDWQKDYDFLPLLDLQEKLKLIETKDEFEEAKIISLLLAENFYHDKKSAVITNDQKLASLLKSELGKRNLPFNDTRNIGVLNSKLINFFLLILELFESDFSANAIISILNHPLHYLSNKKEIIEEFEKAVLRQDRATSGLDGINIKLQSLNKKELTDFFKDFCQKLFKAKVHKNNISLAKYISEIIAVIENLTHKKWQDLLAEEPAQIELFEFFEKLKSNQDFAVNSFNILAIFKFLLAQVSYFEKSDSFAPIQILSSIEARLLNYDLVIIASLNEGDFPQIESKNWESWLGKKIKKDLGIDKKLKKIGQNAYDFCNYLNNDSVILTRCLNKDSSPAICSSFLLKLETLSKKMKINLDRGEKYFNFLNKLNETDILKIERPNPRPEVNFRPKKLAITDISKLISNPYSIYAKRILQLSEIKKVDFEPSYAEFGSFIHKALEDFIKSPVNQKTFLAHANKIFEEYFANIEAKLIWWPKFENIFTNFLQQEEQLKALKNYTEISVKLVLNEILIRGKIDRIILDQDNLFNIFDYKTGQSASAKDVISGIDPQLTIAALMLVEGAIDGELRNISTAEINSINYWKLSASSENEIKKICDKNDEIKILIASAKIGLEKLFEYFADKNNGYISASNLENYQKEYWHLARLEEWNQ